MLKHISHTQTMKKYLNLKWRPPPRALPSGIFKPITERQYRYIMFLGRRIGLSVRQLNQLCFNEYEADLRTMDRGSASKMIQALMRYWHPVTKKKRNVLPPG